MKAARLLALLAVAALVATARAESWPEVKAPSGARVESIASDMILNGRPARLFRFEVNGGEKEVLAFFREQFGAKKVVENRVKNDPVIATRQGDHFITVQLHPVSAQRMQGTVMTTQMLAKPLTSEVSADTRRMLPPDSQVVSTMQSDDAGKRSLMLMAVNQNSTAVNRDHVVQAMQQRGFRVVREDSSPDASNQSISMLLSSSSEEAQVIIANAGKYRSVLINRLKESK